MKDHRRSQFDAQVLVHLDAAYGLARWLLHDEQSAADATQEACLRAWRHFDGWRGDSPRAWFLAIVRNACRDAWSDQQRHSERHDERAEPEETAWLDEEGRAVSPETMAERASDSRVLQACLRALTPEHREVLVLRELHELSYGEIGAVVGVPVGTVMSRLSRARDRLAELLGGTRRRRVG